MIAKNNDILTSATESLYMMNSDELIREQCRAREDFERHERTVQRDLAEQAATIKKQAHTISEQADTITELSSTVTEQADTISALNARIKELESQVTTSK